MKKVKWIALALVLCLGLIGGAYAYWTQELKVIGTVSTGNMDVVFEVVSSSDGDYDEWAVGPEVDSNGNLSFTLGDMYPRQPYGTGSENVDDYTYLELNIKNLSSIPVTLESITTTGSGNLAKTLLCFGFYDGGSYHEVKGVDDLADWLMTYWAPTYGTIDEEGGTKDFRNLEFVIYLHGEDTDDSYNGSPTDYAVELQFNYKQFNDPIFNP